MVSLLGGRAGGGGKSGERDPAVTRQKIEQVEAFPRRLQSHDSLFSPASLSPPLFLSYPVVSISRDCRRSKLNSADGPQFRHPPISVETQYGATEVLQCDVDGNPSPEIRWFHEDSERQVATTPNISVVVNHETAGRYFCKAYVPGFPELTGYANIYIRAPPSIVSQRVQYVPDEGVVKVL